MRNKNTTQVLAALAATATLLLPKLAFAQEAEAFTLAAGTVSGHVFIDADGNGEEDDTDKPAVGCKVTFQGAQLNTDATDDNGDFVSNEAAGQVTVIVDTTEGDCAGGRVTTASNNGTLSQTVTVTGGGTVFVEPVGMYGSAGGTTPVATTHTTTTTTTEQSRTLANTDAEGWKALLAALAVLGAALTVQVIKRKTLTSKINIGNVNLLK